MQHDTKYVKILRNKLHCITQRLTISTKRTQHNLSTEIADDVQNDAEQHER